MMFRPSLYPNLVRLYGYSSRSQKDKNAYVNLLDMRMKAKHGKLSEDVLKPMGLTNDDLKTGLKLPLNAYTGTLRASFNKNADFKQGFGICTTGQLLILQLVYDLQKIPTLEMVSTNTDAVKFYIDSQYEKDVETTIQDWEKLTGLEMEKEVVVKSYMRDVNSYCEIVEINDNEYEVHYKGGEFKGRHKFKWNKEERVFEYSFNDEVETNSLTIVSEALLKKLLFDIPIEDTINNCNDIFRFQIISHMGSTYEKCVQESPNGDIELQKNNRIYASIYNTGAIVKIKSNGARNVIALCPPNPIVDNKNECTIEDINKDWYIELAKQKLNDFKGVKRLENYKKEELLQKAIELGLEVDKKTKKADLIELIKNKEKEVEKMGKEKKEEIVTKTMNIYEKLNAIKKEIMEMDFVVDCDMPNNLGGKEYASIAQYYKAINELSIKYRLYFSWEVTNVSDCYRELFKPQGKPPHHVWAVDCRATFINLDNTEERVVEDTIANGSDICDKGISGGSSLAFRNWFDKNFTPKHLVVDEFGGLNEEISEVSEQTEAPKIPTYIPPEKKEELTKEVVNEVQKEDKDSDDVKKVIDNIMKVRELSGKEDWGSATLSRLISGDIDSVSLMEIELKVNNKLESLVGEE